MYEVTMPKLSDSMETGKVIEWKVREGDAVSEGDVLAEVESDKAVMPLECFASGTLAEIRQGDGAEVDVGEVIALIDESGKQPAAAPAKEAPAEKEEAPTAAVAEGDAPAVAEPEPEKKAPPKKKPEKAPPKEERSAKAAPPAPPRPVAAAPAPGGRVAISPYARKLAEEKGVDYTRIAGSGAGGRIVAADVEAAATGAVPAAPAAPVAPAAAAAAVSAVPSAPSKAARPSPDEELPELTVTPDEADVEPAPFRLRTQATRVVASQHVIPHFYVTRGVDVSALLAARAELKERIGATVTHMIMYACVKALKEHPEVNSSYDRGKVFRWKGVHLGLAVDTDEGLTVAVVRDAGAMDLAALVARTGELVEKARAGRLSADERRHPTFTVTNLGMLDVEHFEPIINPPSSITLAVASALPTPLVRDGAVYVGQVMKLTAACDHRIVDGATAARFLKDLRALLEEPSGLMA